MTTLEQCIGNTPLVKLQRLTTGLNSEVWVKLEGNNPAGSVKDRAALAMIQQAELRGEIQPGDRLIEATSGNTGIALAMIAALKGYAMTLLMPENMSLERQAAMRAYGAELILVSREVGMEGARDLALEMHNQGQGKVLDQFNNLDNPYAHFTTTGPVDARAFDAVELRDIRHQCPPMRRPKRLCKTLMLNSNSSDAAKITEAIALAAG